MSDSSYSIGLTALFLLVGTISALHHEMHRDEIQAWLLARDSSSIIELFRNLKYEGHPGLWHLFLLPLSRITKSPVIMQALHLLIATTTVYLFVRYSPFTRLQKVLFSFGYFSIYEYSIVCRNYSLGVLLLCVFSLLFQKRYTKFLWVGTVLFLLGQTSVHALIISISIGFGLLLEYLFSRKQILTGGTIHEWQIWMGFGLIVLGVIASSWQLVPPVDSGVPVGWRIHYDEDHLKSVMKIMREAFFPVPKATLHFWGPGEGPNWLGNSLFNGLSCLLVVWFSLLLLRKPAALLIYLSGTIGLLSFFYIINFGGTRHHGFLFILFMTVAWIYQDCREAKWSKSIGHFSRVWRKSLSQILTSMLIFHLIGGITALRMDYRYVFSYGKATAEFIKERKMQDMLMVGEADFAVSTIVGYLEKEGVYYPRGDRFGSFIIWDKARLHGISDIQLVQKARELGIESTQDVLLILNHALTPDLISDSSLAELARFTGSTIWDEGFYLYLMRT